MTEAEKIAAELTKGQRIAVIVYMPEAGRWKRCGIIMWSLERLGLVRRRKNPGGSTSCKATPLGLEVRKIIEARSNTEIEGGEQ